MPGSGDPGPYIAFINIPADALLGDTRMRVRVWRDAIVSPCIETEEGEVED